MRSDSEVKAETNAAVLRAELWYARIKLAEWKKEQYRIQNRLDHWSRHKDAVTRRLAELEQEPRTEAPRRPDTAGTPRNVAGDADNTASIIEALESETAQGGRKGKAARTANR